MIAGFIVNKFRGDISLFDDGLTAIGRFTGWRSFGVVPWLREAALLPSEDAVVLEHTAEGRVPACTVAVPMLPRIANFDDFAPLRAEPNVELVFVPPGARLPPRPAGRETPPARPPMAESRSRPHRRHKGAAIRRFQV